MNKLGGFSKILTMLPGNLADKLGNKIDEKSLEKVSRGSVEAKSKKNTNSIVNSKTKKANNAKNTVGNIDLAAFLAGFLSGMATVNNH